MVKSILNSNYFIALLINRIFSLDLVQYGKYHESWDTTFKNFLPIEGKFKPSGYNLQFTFYVQGQSDAYILLSTNQKPTVFDENVYEIRRFTFFF